MTTKDKPPKSSRDLTPSKKAAYQKYRLRELEKLPSAKIREKFEPVLDAVRNGGTFKQAALAGGLTVSELRRLIEFGRFGGSRGWKEFYEEFWKNKADAEQSVMNALRAQAKKGEKWAIERLMSIMDPEAFGKYEMAHLAPGGHAAGETAQVGGVNIFLQGKYDEPLPVVDGEIIQDAETVRKSEIGENRTALKQLPDSTEALPPGNPEW